MISGIITFIWLVSVCTFTVHGAAASVSISNSSWYMCPFTGRYTIVGDVAATGDMAATNLQITARFYYSNRTLIGANSATVDRGATSKPFTLNPTLKAPFRIQLLDSNLSKLVAYYELSTTFSQTSSKPQGLRVISANVVLVGSGTQLAPYRSWNVTGEVRNEGSTTATNTYAMASLYNASGTIVAVAGSSRDKQPGNIPPNQVGTFSLSASCPSLATPTVASVIVESDEYVVPEFPALQFTLAVALCTGLLAYRLIKSLPKRWKPTPIP